MTKKHDRFGKYLLLDHLVDGGMAKISRARYLGEQANKIVAIKMVQPQYSNDPSFKKMFMDEIKVTFGLIHPNVVQTYDYGINNGQLFVAMEYCDGKNLKEYLDKLKEKKFVFPVEISVYIATQASQGLHYAHTITDKMTGLPLSIIHRDISPHNIMLTYDGAVKVIDFGIAKADTNSEATQAGTIKGKLSYLAPEYLEGLQLDPRYDEFAIGITLWEMLCSRKLFKAQNDLAILKKIQECQIPPPSAINPNVPKELDEIVLKALSKDRNKRYENLEQLNRALIKFLYANYPDFNSNDLSYFAKELFQEEIKKDREKFFEYGKIDIRPYLDDMKKELENGSNKPAESDQDKTVAETSSNILKPEKGSEKVLDFGFSEEDTKKTKLARIRESTGIKKVAKSASSVAEDRPLDDEANSSLSIDISQKTNSKKRMGSSGTTQQKNLTRPAVVNKNGSEQTKVISAQNKKTSPLVYALGGIAVVFAFVFFKFPEIEEMLSGEKRMPASSLDDQNVVKEVAKKTKGIIVIKNLDKTKHKVFIDGIETTVSILGEFEAPFGSHSLRIQESGKEHFVTSFDLSETSSLQKVLIPEMPLTSYGYLWMAKPCLEGVVNFTLFGEKRSEKLPFGKTGMAFPIGITHDLFVTIKNEQLERKVSFLIDREDDSIDLCSIVNF